MKFLFIVQGEGRGHMTQAIALSGILESNGHRVTEVLVGKSGKRKIPAFFQEEFEKRLSSFHSPNFISSSDRKGIRPGISILANILLAPLFIREIFRLRSIIRKTDADIVVNFYDMIGGIAYYLSSSDKACFAVSHHFSFCRPDFNWPSGFIWRSFLLIHSCICSMGCASRLALSFEKYESIEKRRLIFMPPLLRKRLFELREKKGDFILAYLLNEGFSEEITDWCRKHPGENVVLYCDDLPLTSELPQNLKVLSLEGEGFLRKMTGARLFISTAGFESICEAAWLGKDIQIIPSKRHFEQKCNVSDAELAGLAKGSTFFNPDSPGFPMNKNRRDAFRKWCGKAEQEFLRVLCNAN